MHQFFYDAIKSKVFLKRKHTSRARCNMSCDICLLQHDIVYYGVQPHAIDVDVASMQHNHVDVATMQRN